MDTKFSSAIHTLILISEANPPMNSDQIATSVGTNGSYIRKLTARLKKSGIIEGHKGISGFELKKLPAAISLLDIYKSVMDVNYIHIFDIHQNPNDRCIVGANIEPVLSGMFHELETQLQLKLSKTTLADCIIAMQSNIYNKKEKFK